MKKLMFSLAAAASLSVAPRAVGQGIIVLDNSGISASLTLDQTRYSNWYTGTFGMEVWERNGTSIPAGIKLSAAPGSGVLAYDAMVAAGFVKEATYVGRTTSFAGAFSLRQVLLPDVNPAGATVVVALAAWNTSATSWSAMLADANQATRAGVVAFVQPTLNATIGDGTPPDLAMDQDLVMTAIPEPSVLALAGLGGALMLFVKSGSHLYFLTIYGNRKS